MFGIGTPELIILAVIISLVWWVIARRKKSRSFKLKNQNISIDKSNKKRPSMSSSAEADSIDFLEEKVYEENDTIIGTEEIPLDNRLGSSTLISEHEFARTATTHLKIEHDENIKGRFKAEVWSVLEAEVRSSLAKAIGMEFGDQVSCRVTVKFEAAPGKLVRYRVRWKQNTRRGIFSIGVGNQTVQVPYSVTFGLYHSIESLSGNK
jgi:hypothetical protein